MFLKIKLTFFFLTNVTRTKTPQWHGKKESEQNNLKFILFFCSFFFIVCSLYHNFTLIRNAHVILVVVCLLKLSRAQMFHS